CGGGSDSAPRAGGWATRLGSRHRWPRCCWAPSKTRPTPGPEGFTLVHPGEARKHKKKGGGLRSRPQIFEIARTLRDLGGRFLADLTCLRALLGHLQHGAQATRADIHILHLAVQHQPAVLHIDLEPALGMPIGVANFVSVLRPAVAHIAASAHTTTTP